MIYCVWYPSGGFGHFINAVLTLHGDNFVRPKKSLEFSANGNSHDLDLVVPKYFHEWWPGGIEFHNNKNYCVLIDNGINNKSCKFRSVFSNPVVIKVCYSDYSWPVVARTMINKAMGRNIDQELTLSNWETIEPWCQREKYFLYLRDHNLRYAWRDQSPYCDDKLIYVDNLIESYQNCFTILDAIAKISNFEDMWEEWRLANSLYIDPVVTASWIMLQVDANSPTDISYINDIWTQAVVYYYIWLKFKIEIPHNDYADWFTNTQEIANLL